MTRCMCGALDCELCTPGGAADQALDDYLEAVEGHLYGQWPWTDGELDLTRDWARECLTSGITPTRAAEEWLEEHR